MKTSLMLLRVLVLVGCLILLLDVRYRGFATWAAACGVYDATYKNCPTPCTNNYFTYSKTKDGPYYIQYTNYLWCTNDSQHGCSASTEKISDSQPQKDLQLCGCGATTQYCEDDGDCCGTDLCQGENAPGTCVVCLADGYGYCDTNADCCNWYCNCGDHFCGCGGLGSACCTSADCCCDQGLQCISGQCDMI
jgi:hypothetical protein